MSNLLSQASLVMIPSGYKEDVVYSQIPTNGNGDLSFTRASNGTRVNSAGLVEVCPWNLAEQSETFDNAAWSISDVTVTANTTIAPNGTTTADTIDAIAVGQRINQTISVSASTSYTFSFYAKKGTMTTPRYTVFDLSNGAFILQQVDYSSLINSSTWSRVTATFTTPVGCTSIGIYPINGVTTLGTIFLWGAQLNIGSTAKPYFPTTDRLNVPRLTYQNGGGGCPSLLLEKQSTNLITYSEQFDNAVYTKRNSTISANATTSPDGTSNADKIQEDTSNNRHDIYTDFTCTNGVTYTQTIFAKQGERRYCFMSFGTAILNAGDSFFDLQDGVVVSSPSGITSSIENMGNGWYRCRITTTCISDGTGYFVNGPANTSSNYIYQGVSGYGIYIWGVQIEASSYPTSYISTTSSSATRVADACFKTGISSLIGQTEGVLFFDGVVNQYNSSNEAIPLSIFSNGGNISGAQQYIAFLSNGRIRYVVYDGSGAQCLIESSAIYTLGTRVKVAAAYKANDFVLYVNGTQIGTDTSGSVNAMADLYLDYQASSNYVSQYTINEIVLSKTRLTNAELASLTTI